MDTTRVIPKRGKNVDSRRASSLIPKKGSLSEGAKKSRAASNTAFSSLERYNLEIAKYDTKAEVNSDEDCYDYSEEEANPIKISKSHLKNHMNTLRFVTDIVDGNKLGGKEKTKTDMETQIEPHEIITFQEIEATFNDIRKRVQLSIDVTKKVESRRAIEDCLSIYDDLLPKIKERKAELENLVNDVRNQCAQELKDAVFEIVQSLMATENSAKAAFIEKAGRRESFLRNLISDTQHELTTLVQESIKLKYLGSRSCILLRKNNITVAKDKDWRDYNLKYDQEFLINSFRETTSQLDQKLDILQQEKVLAEEKIEEILHGDPVLVEKLASYDGRLFRISSAPDSASSESRPKRRQLQYDVLIDILKADVEVSEKGKSIIKEIQEAQAVAREKVGGKEPSDVLKFSVKIKDESGVSTDILDNDMSPLLPPIEEAQKKQVLKKITSPTPYNKPIPKELLSCVPGEKKTLPNSSFGNPESPDVFDIRKCILDVGKEEEEKEEKETEYHKYTAIVSELQQEPGKKDDLIHKYEFDISQLMIRNEIELRQLKRNRKELKLHWREKIHALHNMGKFSHLKRVLRNQERILQLAKEVVGNNKVCRTSTGIQCELQGKPFRQVQNEDVAVPPKPDTKKPVRKTISKRSPIKPLLCKPVDTIGESLPASISKTNIHEIHEEPIPHTLKKLTPIVSEPITRDHPKDSLHDFNTAKGEELNPSELEKRESKPTNLSLEFDLEGAYGNSAISLLTENMKKSGLSDDKFQEDWLADEDLSPWVSKKDIFSAESRNDSERDVSFNRSLVGSKGKLSQSKKNVFY